MTYGHGKGLRPRLGGYTGVSLSVFRSLSRSAADFVLGANKLKQRGAVVRTMSPTGPCICYMASKGSLQVGGAGRGWGDEGRGKESGEEGEPGPSSSYQSSQDF